MRIISVCGARPNFMKVAPLAKAFAARGDFEHVLVHTGQHYDQRMSQSFFDDLKLPRPDLNLEVGSGSHATQTAAIMQRFEPVLLEQEPDAVLVVGDVNSTIGCGLVASKLGVPLIHVEAGLRSFDRTMPEEINRVLTDAISDVLFVSEPAGVENLAREGVAAERIHHVGNVMIDTLRSHRALAERSTILEQRGLSPREYGVVTLHRPANVDDSEAMRRVCAALEDLQDDLPLVFPVHPRTRAALERHELAARLAALPRLQLIEPLGYLDFLKLTADAAVVLTDSGGIQEETLVLGVPCLTLRENTERPITLAQGGNQLVGSDPERILAAFQRVRRQRQHVHVNVPALWDGQAAVRIADVLESWHARRQASVAAGVA